MGFDIIFSGQNFIRLLNGLLVTMRISLVSVVISIIFGIVFGIIMNINNPFIKVISRIYLEIVRIIPQLVLLFIVFFGFTHTFNINLSAQTSSIIVFSFWGIAEMGDLVRGALISIPKSQYDSSKALGLTKFQTYIYIIIPQTITKLIPLSMNLTTRMIKTTSIVVIIGIVEVLKVGQQIIDANRFKYPTLALPVYFVVFMMYFVVCFIIGKIATYIENKWRD